MDAVAIVTALESRGYHPIPGPPPDQQVDMGKEDEELSFAWLTKNDAGQVAVAGGPWAGEPWRDRMLDWPPGRIGTVECAIINPAVQVEIKEMMPIWVPGRPRRAKDLSDIAFLRHALGDEYRRLGVQDE